MKVVLTQDVPKLGDMGTIQDVKDGFARNYLIPQGLALIATPGMIKQVEERQEAERRRVAQLEEEMRDLAEKIDGTRIEIHARVGDQGRLYGSITSADIAERLEELYEQEIDRRKIELDQPIREVGEFTVPVRLVGRLVPTVNVVVFDPAAPLVRDTQAAAEEDEEEPDALEDAVEEVEVESEEAAAIPTATPEGLDEDESAETAAGEGTEEP